MRPTTLPVAASTTSASATSRSNAQRRRTVMTTRMTAESPSAQSTARAAQVCGPPQDGDHRLSDSLVFVWSRVRNRCRKAGQQGHDAEEHRVDRASVSAACLVLGQHQRAVSTESRVRVRCHASAPSSRVSAPGRQLVPDQPGIYSPRSRPMSSFMISLEPAQILETRASRQARATRYSFM